MSETSEAKKRYEAWRNRVIKYTVGFRRDCFWTKIENLTGLAQTTYRNPERDDEWKLLVKNPHAVFRVKPATVYQNAALIMAWDNDGMTGFGVQVKGNFTVYGMTKGNVDRLSTITFSVEDEK